MPRPCPFNAHTAPASAAIRSSSSSRWVDPCLASFTFTRVAEPNPQSTRGVKNGRGVRLQLPRARCYNAVPKGIVNKSGSNSVLLIVVNRPHHSFFEVDQSSAHIRQIPNSAPAIVITPRIHCHHSALSLQKIRIPSTTRTHTTISSPPQTAILMRSVTIVSCSDITAAHRRQTVCCSAHSASWSSSSSIVHA